MPDPNLKEAMIKIKAIMDEHKIGGNITIASRTNLEFLHHFPGWSVAQHDKENSAMRFRSKLKDFENEEHQHRDTEDTVAMIFGMRDLAGRSYLIYESMANDLRKVMHIEHTPLSGFEEHFDN